VDVARIPERSSVALLVPVLACAQQIADATVQGLAHHAMDTPALDITATVVGPHRQIAELRPLAKRVQLAHGSVAVQVPLQARAQLAHAIAPLTQEITASTVVVRMARKMDYASPA